MRAPGTNAGNRAGFGLVELLLALAIAALLLTGLVQIAAGARQAFRLQDAVAELQENGRFAIDALASVLQPADYVPEPWSLLSPTVGILAEAADGISAASDRLAISTLSDRNCYGAPNPVEDAVGQPAYHFRESVLELNSAGNLASTCRYGPRPGQLVVQVQRQGLVENVEAFQVLYAEDTDADGQGDRWVAGDAWADEQQVVGLRIGLLLASSEAVSEPVQRQFTVLDRTRTVPADGHLRQVFTLVQALRGRGA